MGLITTLWSEKKIILSYNLPMIIQFLLGERKENCFMLKQKSESKKRSIRTSPTFLEIIYQNPLVTSLSYLLLDEIEALTYLDVSKK